MMPQPFYLSGQGIDGIWRVVLFGLVLGGAGASLY